MDDFVKDKLTEWGLRNYIEKFRDEKVNEGSLFCLDLADIKELIPELGQRAIFRDNLKELKASRASNDKVKQRKRKSDLKGDGYKKRIPGSQQREPLESEAQIKSKVKRTMESVDARIDNQGNVRMKDFLRTKIEDLETDKRELVGVFGRTGAGKSSLINAVIGEKDLLPSGEVTACTTVMIKVEANMDDDKFRAEIEFIKDEEWENEFWSLQQHVKKNANANMKDDQDVIKKLSAVYGKNWKAILGEKPMDPKHFREIQEFLESNIKNLTSGTARGLSVQLVKYTRNDFIHEEGQNVKRSYWPLVKCVTIKVPNNNFLQHVTIVDLPGNGDRNNSRDKMWREIVGDCSTVWIVAEIVRATSGRETWEILEEVCSLIGNGGECRHIGFICTKSDLLKNKKLRVKEEVREEFNNSIEINKHFSEDCFEVFTVSSTDFLEQKGSQDNEIPKLQEFLKKLNDCHSETLNYVSGAHGILSLIQGARLREAAEVKADVCKSLEENIDGHLTTVRRSVEEAASTFEKCLSEGVEKSRSSWRGKLESIFKLKDVPINPKTLRSVVEKGGIHNTGGGRQINLNMDLASCLLDSIDNEFRKTFPNEGKPGPFNGVINKFSLDTERLIQEYKEVQLHLIFLKTEEEMIKKRLNKVIRNRKKIIYNSLTEAIKEAMKDCYQRAAQFTGSGMVIDMTSTIEMHVQNSEGMFEQAKDAMLRELRHLKVDILKKLRETMMESIELSLKTDAQSLPDVSQELEAVRKLCDELKGSSAEQPSTSE